MAVTRDDHLAVVEERERLASRDFSGLDYKHDDTESEEEDSEPVVRVPRAAEKKVVPLPTSAAPLVGGKKKE